MDEIAKPIPMMKILITMKTSSASPANSDNSAIPRARPPAESVPKPLLNPLLSVAPVKKENREGPRI